MKQRHVRGAAVGLTAAAALSLITVGHVSADKGTDTSALRAAVTVGGILAHEQAFQAIADANGGTRAAGTPGYEASGVYVEDLLEDAGYVVSRQEFTYDQFILNSSAMEETAPTPTVYVEEEDFSAMNYSGSDDVTAAVQAVDINLVGDRAVDEWLRGQRLRRLHTGQHRADPARHVLLPRQGGQRRGGRCVCGDRVQPGQRGSQRRPLRRRLRHARSAGRRHPGGGHDVRHR